MSFFNSRRSDVVSKNGIVATSQPIAAQVGLRILQDGGNAVDAAVGTAAALNVLEPMSTGIGGDMFALVWLADSKKVVAVNGSGRSGIEADPEYVLKKGYSSIPTEGPDSALAVSVPGTVSGWQMCLDLYGTMGMNQVLRDPIKYAQEGFGVSDVISDAWQSSVAKLSYRPSGSELLPGGSAPRHGDIVSLKTLANSLSQIAEGGAEAFYKGDIGKKISRFVQDEGGWITEQDLAEHRSDCDVPISIDYRGVTVWECPPNGQGIAALMALNIAEGFDVASMGSQSVDRYHYLVEAMRLGYADALQYVADPRVSDVPIEGMLSKEYANVRRNLINKEKSIKTVSYGQPIPNSDTVYLTVVDREGNACSFINSLYQGFGTGLVVPDTGIALQNRGALFSLDPNHPNYLQGGKRPYQTIIPGMATRDGELWLSFGVMGGFQQPQGHLQIISNMVDFGMTPQQALDALRFSVDVKDDEIVWVEEDLDESVVSGLKRLGHTVMVAEGYDRTMFGGGQIISRDPHNGSLMGGSEPRKDGAAVGW